MTREEFKKVLMEGGLAETAADEILESFDKYQAKLGEDLQVKIDEGVKAARIDIEKENITKIDEQKAEAETKLEAEIATYEKRLAERVKTVVEAFLSNHGDRILKIVESSEAKKGSDLLNEISEYVVQAKLELAETTADPEEVKSLKTTVAEQKAEIEKLTENHTHETARANVAEQEIATLKEAVVDQPTTVVIEDENNTPKPDDSGTEPAKTTPAAEDHPESQPISEADAIIENEGPEMTDEMRRMRGLAGIPAKE